MPELPEVQTTVTGLQEHLVGLAICDIWSDYKSPYFIGSGTIKDPKYLISFKKKVIGAKITGASRRAKNVLIHLSNGLTILIHMKMTGHIMYGTYEFDPKDSETPKSKKPSHDRESPWVPISPESLKDPYNRHIHLMLTLSDGKRLALCDSRKFAKVTLIEKVEEHFADIGPEPLEKGFTLATFKERLALRPNGKIKQVLMDQYIVAGIGNIYADESLWRAGIHPLEIVSRAPSAKLALLFKAVRSTLSKGIDFGGDSTSDYRNILGERGAFHETHEAYRRTGQKCRKPGCGGTIRRVMVGARSAHYCDKHQKLSSNL